MRKGDKINLHPDKAEIIKRLTEGETVKSVERWLKRKYSSPAKKKFQISYRTLHEYSRDVLRLKEEMLEQIRANRDKQLMLQPQQDASVKTVNAKDVTVLDKDAQETAVNLVSDQVIQMGETLQKIHEKIWERVEVIEGTKYRASSEQVLCNYVAQARGLITYYFNMLDKQEKKNTNINISMQQVEQQQNVLKLCIQETLQEVCPEAISVFLDKLRMRLDQANQGATATPQQSGTNVNINIKA